MLKLKDKGQSDSDIRYNNDRVELECGWESSRLNHYCGGAIYKSGLYIFIESNIINLPKRIVSLLFSDSIAKMEGLYYCTANYLIEFCMPSDTLS